MKPTEPRHDPVPPEALAARHAGDKVKAIKLIREHLGVDLKTAKDLADNHALTPGGKPASDIPQKHMTPLILPILLGFAAIVLLVKAVGMFAEGSNASYCASATRGKHLMCKLAPEWAEALLGTGQGYIGSAMLPGLLAVILVLMVIACRGNGQRK